MNVEINSRTTFPPFLFPPHLDLPRWRAAASARRASPWCAQEPTNRSHPTPHFVDNSGQETATLSIDKTTGLFCNRDL